MSKHEQTKCRSLLGSLSDYVDGTLSDELCDEIERHVTGCQNCTAVVNTLRRTITLYHEVAEEEGDVTGVVRERLFRILNLDDYIKH